LRVFIGDIVESINLDGTELLIVPSADLIPVNLVKLSLDLDTITNRLGLNTNSNTSFAIIDWV
jgi:hypothetical protein